MPKLKEEQIEDLSNPVIESKKAVDKFNKLGFKKAEVPEEQEPKMPTRISNLTPASLGDLMAKYSSWREYAEENHAKAAADYTALKADYDYKYAVRLQSMTQTVSLAEKERRLSADKQLNDLYVKVLEAEMYMNLLGAKVESHNNSIAVISREITRRGLTMENRHG